MKEQTDLPIINTLRKVVVHAVDTLMKEPERWGDISIAHKDQILHQGQILELYKHIKSESADK